MIHGVFTIHDVKAGAYLPPFILPKSEMAQRTFADCINSQDHQFGQHPEDYTLFELGHFDDETASYLLHNAPKSLGNGVDFRSQQEAITTMEGQHNAETPSPDSPQPDDSPVQSGAKGANSQKLVQS